MFHGSIDKYDVFEIAKTGFQMLCINLHFTAEYALELEISLCNSYSNEQELVIMRCKHII